MNKEDIVEIQHPNEWKEGVRILMRCLRSKEGKSESHTEKIVSRSVDEFYEVYRDLMSRRVGQERIYATTDERDMDKAIHLFKQRQLDADYFDEISRHSFYTDIHNRWISALQNPTAAKTSFFMVDIDNGEDNEASIRAQIEVLKIEIAHEYPTKNGTHLILKPFNPNGVQFQVQKNGMMLLAYNAYKNTKL